MAAVMATPARHVKFSMDAMTPLALQIPDGPMTPHAATPHSGASPHTPHTPTPSMPGTPYTPGGHPRCRDSSKGNDPTKVLRDRALRRMNGNKEEVNNIMTANYATNVQRVKAIIMQSKSGTRDLPTLGTLCEFTCEWFRKQSEDTLGQLCQALQLETCMNNSVIFRKGDPSDKVYIVLMGGVELVDNSAPLGQQTTVLKRGECIGAQACLEMKPRVNMCMAKGHTELLLVARKPFLTIFKDKFDAASADSVHFLRSEVPLFKGLSVEQAQVLARSVSVEHVARGKMFQLDTCDSLWTLRDGEARLMAPDPQDAGKPSDAWAVFGKDFSYLTTRERKELKDLKLQREKGANRLRRCHPILHLTQHMSFGDNFNELFPFSRDDYVNLQHTEALHALRPQDRVGWFVRTETKCTLYELKKVELPQCLSAPLLATQRSEALFRLTYYAGRHAMYFSAKAKAKLLKERVPPPPRTVQSFFTLPPPVLSARVQALVSLADVVKQAPVQHAQPAPYNKIGSTSVASENALKKYRDNIANLNMRRLTQTLHSLTVPLDPRFNAKTGRWMGGGPPKQKQEPAEADAWDAAFTYSGARPSTAAAHTPHPPPQAPPSQAPSQAPSYAFPAPRVVSTAPSTSTGGERDAFFLTAVPTRERASDAAEAERAATGVSGSWVDADSPRPTGYKSPPRRNRSGYPDVSRMPAWSAESVFGNPAAFTTPFKVSLGDAAIPPLPSTPPLLGSRRKGTPAAAAVRGSRRPHTVDVGFSTR